MPRSADPDSASEVYEASTHSFIVKIWLERTAAKARRAVWRGHVTHAFSGRRRYFQNLEDIALFIVPYLEQLDVRMNWWWRVRRWLRYKKQPSTRRK